MGETLTFTANLQPSNATTPINYTWSSDGLVSGQWATSATYSWAIPGMKTITATAENCGGIVSDTHTIEVSCISLDEVEITGPTEGYVDIFYTLTAVTTPADATPPITYTWSPEPGNGQGTGSAEYQWATPGVYTVTVEAENCGGIVSNTLVITIERGEPDITVDPLTLSAILNPGSMATRKLTIGNAGTATANLTWSLAESPAATWLSEKPVSGTVPPDGSQSVDVIFDATGLSSED